MHAALAHKRFGISKPWPPGDGGSRARERLGGMSIVAATNSRPVGIIVWSRYGAILCLGY